MCLGFNNFEKPLITFPDSLNFNKSQSFHSRTAEMAVLSLAALHHNPWTLTLCRRRRLTSPSLARSGEQASLASLTRFRCSMQKCAKQFSTDRSFGSTNRESELEQEESHSKWVVRKNLGSWQIDMGSSTMWLWNYQYFQYFKFVC